MKNTRKQLKLKDENNMKQPQKKFKIKPKISQLIHRNNNNILIKDPNSLTYRNNINSNNIFKDNLEISQNKKNKKLFFMPNIEKEQQNIKELNFNILDNNNGLDINDINKHKILIFPKTEMNDNETYKERNNSVEDNHNKIYVHKKLKNTNNIKMNTSRNKNNIKEIEYRNSFYQTNKNKNYYSKLNIFSNKNKYFRKNNLSEIEYSNSNNINNTIKNMKYLNRSPIIKNEQSFSKTNENQNDNNNEDSFNNKNININYDNNNDFPDEIGNRYNNINDYINIYSINNKSINNNKKENLFNDENNFSPQEDKIIIKKKNNKAGNKKIIINTNKINNLKNEFDKNQEKNTININKNIIINKKIILIPDEKNDCSKTSYEFFNTYENKFKNIINMPFSNNNESYYNKNINIKDNLSHSKNRQVLNNLIYKKKSFVSPSSKISKYINFLTENNNCKSSRNINNLHHIQPFENYQMSNTTSGFYEQKKNYFDLSGQTFNKKILERKNITNLKNYINYNSRFNSTKGRIKKDNFYKLNFSDENINKIKINNNPNILIINERSDNENENEDNSETKEIKLSLLEISKTIEIKLKLIINKITKYQNCEKDCYYYINFYFENNFYKEKIQLFKNTKNRESITNYTKMEIIYLFLCYNILCSKKFNKACIIIKTILSLLYDNFILILIFIIKNNKTDDKKLLKSLNIIVNEHIAKNNNLENINMNINENKLVELIGNNSNETINYYRMLIDSLYQKYYNEKDHSVKFPDCIKNINIIKESKESNNSNKIKNIISSFFNEIYKKIQNFDFDEYKLFFYTFLSNKKDKNLKKRNSKTKKLKKYERNAEKDISLNRGFFLPPIKNNYKHTLILNLNETLVYFNNKYPPNLAKNTLILRPNVQEFLHEMKYLYELIIFSDCSKEYIEPIIDIIQQKEKFFSYVLWNKYITLNNKKEKIKDLFWLGRELKNIIAVDNIEKYYKLNKDNLICIKPFCGDINNDKNTLKLLGNFLKELKIDYEKTKDMRNSLKNLKYKFYPKIINYLD